MEGIIRGKFTIGGGFVGVYVTGTHSASPGPRQRSLSYALVAVGAAPLGIKWCHLLSISADIEIPQTYYYPRRSS